MQILFKDPDATKDFHVEWQGGFADGDYVETSTWVAPDGITATEPSLFVGYDRVESGKLRPVQRATVFLAGGVMGSSYIITNRVTTVRGRTMDQSFELRIREE